MQFCVRSVLLTIMFLVFASGLIGFVRMKHNQPFSRESGISFMYEQFLSSDNRGEITVPWTEATSAAAAYYAFVAETSPCGVPLL
jgi:hypothetical protein